MKYVQSLHDTNRKSPEKTLAKSSVHYIASIMVTKLWLENHL